MGAMGSKSFKISLIISSILTASVFFGIYIAYKRIDEGYTALFLFFPTFISVIVTVILWDNNRAKEKETLVVSYYDKRTFQFGILALLFNWMSIGFPLAIFSGSIGITVAGLYIGAILSPLLAVISILYNVKSKELSRRILALFLCIVAFFITAIFWWLHSQGNIGGY